MSRSASTTVKPAIPASNTTHEVSVGVVGSIIAAILVLVVSRFIFTSLLRWFYIWKAFVRLYSSLASVRMESFNRDRNDYSRRSRKAKRRSSISEYLASADHEIVIVSATFATAVFHENIGETFREFVVQRRGRVVLLLLDPNNKELVESVSRTLSRSPSELKSEITSAMNRLIEVHAVLPPDCKQLLQLRFHRTIPFASAIILDPATQHGSIQIETKPYKAGMDASIGFTLNAGGEHPLYTTLVQAYRDLINDGRDAISLPMLIPQANS